MHLLRDAISVRWCQRGVQWSSHGAIGHADGRAFMVNPSSAPRDDSSVLASNEVDTDSNPPPPNSADFRHLRADDIIEDKYRLLRQLGEGGMGSVWAARNVLLEVDVAIKIVRPDVRNAVDASMVERLLHEARATAQLRHPAIVSIMDFGATTTGDPFIVMELLTGVDLSAHLAAVGRLSPVNAVRMILPIVQAMNMVHDHDILHRDLKPENIMLVTQDDGEVQPKLIDFGVARITGKGAGRITSAGTLVGSPAYMAPEQARGEDADQQSDVWALAVVLYELMTGTLPFDAENQFGIIRAVVELEPKPLAELGVHEAELAAIVSRGLQKDPSERWGSMRDFGLALADWLTRQGIFDDVSGRSVEAMFKRRASSLTNEAQQPSSARIARRDRSVIETQGGGVGTPSSRSGAGSGTPDMGVLVSTPLLSPPRKPLSRVAIAGALGLGLAIAAFSWMVVRAPAKPDTPSTENAPIEAKPSVANSPVANSPAATSPVANSPVATSPVANSPVAATAESTTSTQPAPVPNISASSNASARAERDGATKAPVGSRAAKPSYGAPALKVPRL